MQKDPITKETLKMPEEGKCEKECSLGNIYDYKGHIN